MTTAPEHDCPPCPKCGLPLGTPCDQECGVEPGRWDGPRDATLFCPSCGAGWVGSTEDVSRAWRAWEAYEGTFGEGPL